MAVGRKVLFCFIFIFCLLLLAGPAEASGESWTPTNPPQADNDTVVIVSSIERVQDSDAINITYRYNFPVEENGLFGIHVYPNKFTMTNYSGVSAEGIRRFDTYSFYAREDMAAEMSVTLTADESEVTYKTRNGSTIRVISDPPYTSPHFTESSAEEPQIVRVHYAPNNRSASILGGKRGIILGNITERRISINNSTIVTKYPSDYNCSIEERQHVLRTAGQELNIGGQNQFTYGVIAGDGIRLGNNAAGKAAEGSFAISSAQCYYTSVVAHEYVHTRQEWNTTNSTRWLTEASATYYGAVIAAHAADNYSIITRDLNTRSYSGVLSDPDTWWVHIGYTRGARVLSQLNRRLLAATNNETGVEEVLYRLNSVNQTLTHERMISVVSEVDTDSADWLDNVVDQEEDVKLADNPSYYQSVDGELSVMEQPAESNVILNETDTRSDKTDTASNETGTTPQETLDTTERESLADLLKNSYIYLTVGMVVLWTLLTIRRIA